MKAVRISETGAPEVMKLVEIDQPIVRAGEVGVQVKAAGVNYIDVYYREGVYQAELPLVLGVEGAGVIESVGEGVKNFQVGDAVAWCMYLGAYAEYAVVPERHLVPIPQGLDFEAAAGALLQGMTAHYMTRSVYALKAGETILVHSAAGGSGLLLTQMATQLGVRVIAMVSTDAKAQMATEAGAQDVILYGEHDFDAEVKRRTEGRGVDVVYDGVGKATFNQSLRCLRPRGLMVLFGASSGAVPPVDPVELSLLGSLYLTRPSLAHYTLTREELNWRSGEVYKAILQGTLKLHLARRYGLNQVVEAHQDLEARKTTGKLLVTP